MSSYNAAPRSRVPELLGVLVTVILFALSTL